METKKNTLLAGLLVGMGYVASSLAADGQIIFTGSMTSPTCVISVNNQGATATVNMPPVLASQLAHGGDTAGETPFRITLDSCTGPTVLSAYVYFEPAAGYTATAGMMNNKSGPGYAENIRIELLRDSYSLNLEEGVNWSTWYASAADLDINTVTNSASGDFVVRYYAANDSVTAGTVQTVVNYTIIYL
ncbi:fimbrial protein [Entomohabitans teleogrylli]|uniref:fimbrial protein n=1 Tax=Entomohabitans teleogrylli TaxID=1384589 RepID=UPI00073DA458|nr:fimbrial protein [Entomohabitans teleogrylli]